eukprot:4035315-Amphidinium_carterae.1
MALPASTKDLGVSEGPVQLQFKSVLRDCCRTKEAIVCAMDAPQFWVELGGCELAEVTAVFSMSASAQVDAPRV